MDSHPTFGALLKQYRRAAHLSQQDLATHAGYSSHYVSMLERGVRSPQPLTVDLLADALALPSSDRSTLHAAVQSLLSTRVSPHDIPLAPLPLIGREQETAHMVGLVQRDNVRVVTITGPGGVGKTSLAQQVAVALRPNFTDGIVFVDLAVVDRADDVIPAIARALSLRKLGSRSIQERLTAFLREREILLLLDSFEHVVEAAAAIADLLAAGLRSKLLVTSRVPLRLRVEHEFRVQPLTLPPSEHAPSICSLRHFPALDLFVQRARLVKPDFALDDQNAVIVAEICRRLDGLPLAIELAAARLSHLPPATLRDRLQHRLQILTGGTRDVPDRQKRMRDTIAWSYDLLAPPDQALLRRLSVFAGSWSLEAAETVCAEVEPVDDVLDGLRTLVDSSLVTSLDDLPAGPRYRLLDTIREFALEHLEVAGELEATHRRHSQYYLRLGEQAEPEMQGREQEHWYEVLQRDHDNLRAALTWLLAVDDAEGALRLSGAVWRFWQRHGDIREGRRWLDKALSLPGNVPNEVQAKALWGAGWLAYYEGDYERSRSLSAQHLALARACGDALSTRNALTGLGMVALAEGKFADAVVSLQAALDVCRPLGNIWHRATSFLNLGSATMLAGDLDSAAALFQEALALYRERSDEVFTARALQYLGYIALLRAEYARAGKLFKDSLDVLCNLGDRAGMADGLEGVAAARAAVGTLEGVAQLMEAAALLREEIGVPAFPFLRSIWEPHIVQAEEQLGEVVWTMDRGRGRTRSYREVIAGVLNGRN